MNNGGDYVASRRALLHAYVAGWLLSLHNLDISAYPSIIFDAIREFVTDYASNVDALHFTRERVRVLKRIHGTSSYLSLQDTCENADSCLKFIIKLSQTSVTFTALDDLFLLWLKSLEYEVLDTAVSVSSGWWITLIKHQSIPAVQRLLNKDGDSAARSSTYVDATLTSFGDNGMKLADPWGTVQRFTERPDGLTSGLMWLRLFARSGVDIDTSIIAEYNNLMLGRRPTLAQGVILMEAILISTWLKSMGRQELQSIITQMMTFFQPAVQTSLQSSSNMTLACVIIYCHGPSPN